MPEAALARAIAPGLVVPGGLIPALLAETGLPDRDALMLAFLPLAQSMARPPVSQFRVGAVGLAAGSGDLILGANVEFPGAGPAETIHAEQFLFARAYHLGERLSRIAVSARPCGHCRQFMNEFAGADGLTILDPSGDRQGLRDLLPFSFGPADLGQSGAGPQHRQGLRIGEDEQPDGPLDALRDAGERAYTPYGSCPSAVLLTLADGTRIAGSAIENAAYNPGLPPLQAALINLIAMGRRYDEIESAVLGQVPGAAFDHFAATAKLLSIIAPGALLDTLSWQLAQSS